MPTTNLNPAIVQAMASVEAATAHAATDPRRPRFHFRPPANWMNDPNGTIYHDGYYHLFYQHNPYGDDWGHMHWGHGRSRDLVHWEHLPIALWPSLELGEEHVFSGCARVNGAGEPMLFYTSVGTGDPRPGGTRLRARRRRNEQWAAVGDADWLTWRKHPANPVLALDTHGGPDFEGEWRDPYIFDADGRTFLVLGGDFGETSAVALYEAADAELTRWTYRKLLYTEPRHRTRFCECPNFIPVGDKWVLLTSPYRPVEYVVGDFDVASLTFTPQQRGILDPGYNETATANFYATNTVFAPRPEAGAPWARRVILLGWVRGFAPGRGWNGCLAIPRVLTVGPDNRPRQTPVAELDTLRGAHQSAAPVTLSGAAQVVDRLDRSVAEIQATLDPGDAPRCGLRLHPIDANAAAVDIIYDRQTILVDGIPAPLALDPGALLDLRIYLDGAVMEVFAAQGRVAVTRVVDLPVDGLTVEAVAHGGDAHLTAYDRWEMTSIW